MIVCSCNVLTKARIAEAAEALSDADRDRPVTPGRVFRALGARPQCGNCFPLIRRIFADAGVAFTCPEPLASVAENAADAAGLAELVIEVDIMFDAAGRVP